jgi:hypothetical protein
MQMFRFGNQETLSLQLELDTSPDAAQYTLFRCHNPPHEPRAQGKSVVESPARYAGLLFFSADFLDKSNIDIWDPFTTAAIDGDVVNSASKRLGRFEADIQFLKGMSATKRPHGEYSIEIDLDFLRMKNSQRWKMQIFFV